MKRIFLISEVSHPNMNRIAEELKRAMIARSSRERERTKHRTVCVRKIYLVFLALHLHPRARKKKRKANPAST